MDISKLLRPEVKHFEPYLPGKPLEEVQRELGLKKVIKLASNENALGTSPKAARALRKDCSSSYRYPDGSGTLLRRALAKNIGVGENEIILGAGSDEVIELLGKTFFNPTDEIIVSAHAFIRYQMAADLMGAKTVVVPMQDYKHDLNAMAAKINSNTKALFIANPNNPTGTYVTQKEVEEFLSLSNVENVPFIVFDEAYYEYSKELAQDYPNTLKFFKERENLIILRTFSKIYGLAGLRVGYGIGKEGVISHLDRVRPPFNVSTPAQKAAVAALRDKAHLKKSVQVTQKGMKYLLTELEKLNLKTVPSSGNFLLIDVAPRRGKDLFKQLLLKGVIVRSVDEYELPHHMRVTVGLEKENWFFIEKLKEVLKQQ